VGVFLRGPVSPESWGEPQEMTTYRSFEYDHAEPLPDGVESEVRSPEALVESVLREHSAPGDRVLDPFAGFGTTLTVAERLDREAFGLEYESDRADYIRDQVAAPERVRQGDVLEMKPSWFPPCDCVFTSPPFMERADDRNPFRNYAGTSTYADYLDDIEAAFGRLDTVLAPGARVAVHVANMKHEGRVTPLAWDVADRVSRVFEFEGETVITWECDGAGARAGQFGYGYDHTYCHLFRKPNERG